MLALSLIDTETKLIVNWYLGRHDIGTTKLFMNELAGRLANHIQLITDEHRAYLHAVENAFGANINYNQLVKI